MSDQEVKVGERRRALWNTRPGDGEYVVLAIHPLDVRIQWCDTGSTAFAAIDLVAQDPVIHPTPTVLVDGVPCSPVELQVFTAAFAGHAATGVTPAAYALDHVRWFRDCVRRGLIVLG